MLEIYEICLFCAYEEYDLKTHLVENHNILFGADILVDISRLTEVKREELKNVLLTFRETGMGAGPEYVKVESVTENSFDDAVIDKDESVTENSIDDVAIEIDKIVDFAKSYLENEIDSASTPLQRTKEEPDDSVHENNAFGLSLQESLVSSDSEIKANSKFVCQFCDQKIVGLQHFLVHIKDQGIHSQDIRTVLACPYEGCENDSEHEDANKENSPLHCPVRGCNFKPAWNSYYYNNIKDLLRTPSASWKMLRTIEDHINAKHARINPFTCDKCGKGFKSKMSHEYHKRRHLDSIYCDSCQHFFTSTDKYVNHNSKCGKVGSKQYSCDNCDKMFLSKGNLYTHKRIHSDVKYPCDVCGKKFTQKGNRNTHTAKKHNENQY